MNFFSYGVTAFQEKALSTVNSDMVTVMDDMAVYLAPLFTFKNMQIFAADNAGLFELGCNNRSVRGLSAAGG